ncbi:MAG: membrane dipeptidase [Candidatus Latescibacteria bacterium]|nr:membrane dipeptidase [Candidatus Latescibacterota bacterium]
MSPSNLHQDALVIDSHNDSMVAHIRRGHMGLAGERDPQRRRRPGGVGQLRQYMPPEQSPPLQLNIPLMRQGGLDAAFFAVDNTLARNNHLLYATDALGFFSREVEEHANAIRIARCAADITQAKAAGQLAAILAVENSNALEQSIHVLWSLHQLGVRTITLTHSTRTWAGDGCEVEGGGGLTTFGRQVVSHMNQWGLLVDISHLNDQGFWDVLEQTQKPVIASHSCCRALCSHPRNLTDEQLRALGQQGGVVGITFVPMFVKEQNPTFADLLDHIDHAVQLAGIDHVGLGSDFDGGGDLVTSAAEFPDFTTGLQERGYGEDDIRKILGLNHLRLLEETIGRGPE